LWERTAVNHCKFLQMERTRCHAVVNITLTMIQKGSTVGGFYECRRGPMSFRNLDDIGGIENGAVCQSSVLFRVMLPDGSSCIFNRAS
jgi:hypothetical protein